LHITQRVIYDEPPPRCTGSSAAIYLTCLQAKVQTSEPSITEIREELQNVLSSPRFRHSPRLTRLLRYISNRALTSEAEQITEYTIALDVLGKSDDFKEGKDAIVRVEVHRLRKRLAEFYADEGASHRLRIVIPTGNYTPQFQVHDGPPAEEAPAALPIDNDSVAPTPSAFWLRGWPNGAWIAAIGLLLVGAILPAVQVFRPQEKPLDAFWNPVLSSSSQVLLCIGNQAGGHTHPPPDENGQLTLKAFHTAENQMVHVADATTLARFASLIQARGKRYRIVSQSEATYADLQNSPVVLIGLLNNDWTRRLVGDLRFTVDRPGPGKVRIRDRDNPARTDWFIDYYAPFLDIVKDYALVMRATDPKTEQMTVTAAGMSIFGTLAAGEFLTDPNEIRKLDAVAPRDWKRRNLEIVLSTDVIRGNPGPPTVVATHLW
jgi:hypothetical protein